MLDALATALIPDAEIELAAVELRRRLKAETPGTIDKERDRLRAYIAKLDDLYAWGHIDESEYRRRRADAEATLTEISEDDKLVTFERQRAVVQTLPQSIASASMDKLQELVALLVERVDTANRSVSSLTLTPPARPFFAAAGADADSASALFWRPRTDSGPQYPRSALDWYLEVG